MATPLAGQQAGEFGKGVREFTIYETTSESGLPAW
jgi:hypothetical protein